VITMSELQLITPRRNFLIRALGFTAAGAVLPIAIITADDAQARIAHHQAALEKAWRDYYGISHNVRTVHQASPAGLVVQEDGFQSHLATSIFMICAGGNVVG
jgi:adenosyl cobinamide kinase/adenosyl cobinamide phosphate guanylyltransferase